MLKPSKTTNNLVPAVSVKDVRVTYGSNVVLESISFDIAQGQVAAIIGPNGSGKTTIMRAILGLVPVAAGEIRVFGKHFHAVRDLVGYVPQRFDFDRGFPLTVREFMDLTRHEHCPRSRIREMIAEVGLTPATLDARLGSLSGGQLQRVLIAQAILNNPKILMLDEPSSGIDIAGEETFHEIIGHLNASHGTTILLVSHDIAMVSSLVDNVICVNKKLLCYGPPRTALTERKIGELFGPRVDIYEHPHARRRAPGHSDHPDRGHHDH